MCAAPYPAGLEDSFISYDNIEVANSSGEQEATRSVHSIILDSVSIL